MKRTIAVTAPSNSMADLASELIEVGRRNIASLGFNVQLGANVNKRFFHTAGTLADRLADFQRALEDPAVEIIMPVFGGYNSNQLLESIDYERVAESGKAFVGYSDITALLVAIGKLSRVRVIHGPSFSTFCDPNLFEYTRAGFSRVLKGAPQIYLSPEFTADDKWYLKKDDGPRDVQRSDGWKVYREGEAIGPIVGGNLETICALAGTRYFPDFDAHIVFLEDASGDNPGAFHRNMTQLSQMGIFDQISGLLIGKMPRQSKLADRKWMEVILDDVLLGRGSANRNYPVICEVNCSHVDPMMSIPLYEGAFLSTIGEPRLTVNFQREASLLPASDLGFSNP